MQKITVRVGKDGRARVEISGVSGPDCLKHTEALRQRLGETLEIEYTAEYHETEDATEGPVQEQQKEG